MKKKLILFMMILFLPIFVKADMGAPMSSYKVRVSKVEGIDTYEWNRNTNRYEPTQEKLSYDTILTIRYENIRDNILFGQAYNNETDKSYEIKLSDVSPVEINLNDYKKETKSKYYVFDDTCYLYKGPSKVYDKISPETSLPI